MVSAPCGYICCLRYSIDTLELSCGACMAQTIYGYCLSVPCRMYRMEGSEPYPRPLLRWRQIGFITDIAHKAQDTHLCPCGRCSIKGNSPVLLVVGSTGEKPPAGVRELWLFVSFRPTMRRGKRAADIQNHTTPQSKHNCS